MKIIFSKDKRIFTLFCWLNICGYNDENNKLGFHSVRTNIIEWLKKQKSDIRCDLSKKIHRSKFVQWILHRGDPPDFKKITLEWYGTIPESEFDDLDKILSSFYKGFELEGLWKEYQDHLEEEIKKYSAVEQELSGLVEKLRIIKPPQEVILIPNLMDAYWRGTGKKIDGNAYVVFGPSGEEPNYQLIRHEFLHSIVDPVLRSNSGDEKDMTFLSETIIRAINVLLSKNPKALLETEKKRGFEQITTIYKSIEHFLKHQKMSFEEYLQKYVSNNIP